MAAATTFIYGHNRWAVFYKLLKVQPGDEAIVSTANGHTFTYKMTGQKVTQPTDTSLFHYQGPPILTLQTCSRLVVPEPQPVHLQLGKRFVRIPHVHPLPLLPLHHHQCD